MIVTIPADIMDNIIRYCLDPDSYDADPEDLLIDPIDEYGIDQDQVDRILTAARTHDPRSAFAVIVRDVIRNNTSGEVDVF